MFIVEFSGLWDQFSIVMYTDDFQILLYCCCVVFCPCLKLKFLAEEIKFVNHNSGRSFRKQRKINVIVSIFHIFSS